MVGCFGGGVVGGILLVDVFKCGDTNFSHKLNTHIGLYQTIILQDWEKLTYKDCIHIVYMYAVYLYEKYRLFMTLMCVSLNIKGRIITIK